MITSEIVFGAALVGAALFLVGHDSPLLAEGARGQAFNRISRPEQAPIRELDGLDAVEVTVAPDGSADAGGLVAQALRKG